MRIIPLVVRRLPSVCCCIGNRCCGVTINTKFNAFAPTAEQGQLLLVLWGHKTEKKATGFAIMVLKPT